MAGDKIEITVQTDIWQDGVIMQTFLDGHKMLFRQVINVSEQHFKEAMIKLGWTPPPEVNNG